MPSPRVMPPQISTSYGIAAYYRHFVPPPDIATTLIDGQQGLRHIGMPPRRLDAAVSLSLTPRGSLSHFDASALKCASRDDCPPLASPSLLGVR